jgi:hypothetical protein
MKIKKKKKKKKMKKISEEIEFNVVDQDAILIDYIDQNINIYFSYYIIMHILYLIV